MATLHVRNVPEDVYEALRQQAAREGRSVNAETIVLLRGALGSAARAEDLLRELAALRKRLPWPAPGPTPEEVIREARDAG